MVSNSVDLWGFFSISHVTRILFEAAAWHLDGISKTPIQIHVFLYPFDVGNMLERIVEMVLYKRHIKACYFRHKRHGLGTKGKVQQIVHSAGRAWHLFCYGSFLITLVCRCYGMPISVLALLWAGVGCLPGWRFEGPREVPEWQRQVQSSFCVLVFQYWVALCGTFFYGRFEKNNIANSSNLWCLSLFLFNMYSQSVLRVLLKWFMCAVKLFAVESSENELGLDCSCVHPDIRHISNIIVYMVYVCVPIYT